MQIISLKKKGRYFSAELKNNSKKYKLHPDIVLEFSIYEGSHIDIENWNDIIQKNDCRFAWESAVKMLSLRAHSKQDIKDKLSKKGFKSPTIEKVINECKRLNLIDDAEFAKEYTRELKESGCGIKMIKLKLSRKGVPHDLIDRELEESLTEKDELAAAKTALRKKLPSLKREPDPLKRKEKLYRYMASKGFSYEVIEKAGENVSI